MCDESVNFSTLALRVLKFGICKQMHTERHIWWARLDSNQRRINRRIYSAMPLPLGD